jgi:hypothetical protein
MTTKVGLDKHAYTGRPEGYRRSSFPNGEPILHPSEWNREHWSFDESLKTRAKAVHVPMCANDALNLMERMLSATQSVSK